MASASRATAPPARPMRTETGSGAAASTAAISSGVRTGSMTRPRLTVRGGAGRDADRLGHGAGVGEAEVPGRGAPLAGELGRPAVQGHRRGAVAAPHDLDVAQPAGA